MSRERLQQALVAAYLSLIPALAEAQPSSAHAAQTWARIFLFFIVAVFVLLAFLSAKAGRPPSNNLKR